MSDKLTCPRCQMEYASSREKHICLDGSTYARRIEERQKCRNRASSNPAFDNLRLSYEDFEFLKGLKIKVD